MEIPNRISAKIKIGCYFDSNMKVIFDNEKCDQITLQLISTFVEKKKTHDGIELN